MKKKIIFGGVVLTALCLMAIIFKTTGVYAHEERSISHHVSIGHVDHVNTSNGVASVVYSTLVTNTNDTQYACHDNNCINYQNGDCDGIHHRYHERVTYRGHHREANHHNHHN